MTPKRRRIVALTDTLERRVLLSTYYVSTAGADSNPGTALDRPLQTLQEAANRAQPGDTVLVRSGTYRETVKPAHSGTAASRITFRPYNGETVTVSGADPVTGWTRHSGSVFKAAGGVDLGEGTNQVFVDGRMMNEARWPNTTLDVSRPKKASADSVDAVFAGQASYATLVDADLAAANFPAGAWDGGVLHISSGQSWVTQTADVTDSAGGRLSFDYAQRTSNFKSDRFETPEAGDPYFLTGKFVALDAAGEWFYDGSDDALYLWTPAGDTPADHVVEAKARKYAFDLSGRSYVDVQGIDVFAATIVTDAASTGVRLDGINAQYLSQFSSSPTGWEVPIDSGIYLAGKDSSLRNSTIAFSAGHGVVVTGAFNRVENNVIHDVAYSGVNGSGVRVSGVGHVLRSNTIYNAGRTGVLHSSLVGGRVVYNTIHDVMLQTTDGGGTYTFGTDGGGTEVAYNRIYNIRTGGFGGAGLYLDNGSSNHLFHHNLVYNVDHAIKLNPPSLNNQIFNNTLVGTSRSVATSGTRDMTGTSFRNNVFTRTVDIGATAVQEANVYASAAPQFVDPAAADYRLQPTSPAVDKGIKLPPYTDGYAGAAPDAGAFEYGQAAWASGAGSSAAVRDDDAPSVPRSLTATASAAGVTLDWLDAPDADRMGYHVYRAASAAGPFVRIDGALVTASGYLDSLAPQEAASYYRVVTVDTSDNASAAASANAFVAAPPGVPAAPANLLIAPASATAINLAWDAVADVFGYRVERKGPGETSFREIARTAGRGFRDGGLVVDGTYAYRVRAENLRGVSAPGAAVSGAPLLAPSGLSVTVAGPMQADLSWSNVGGETRFDVQRSGDGLSGWLTIAATMPDVTAYSDVSVPTDELYFYRVLAVGPGGASRPSAVVGNAAVASAYASADIDSTPEGRTTVVAADTAFDVVAGGRNVFGTGDGFRFVYKPVTGDFDLKVRLTSLAAVVSTTKAGLMARETLDAGSRNVFASATASGELRYSVRAAAGGETTLAGSGVRGTFPDVWLRLRRRGDALTAYGSVDGTAWVQTGADTLDELPDTVFVGMAVSAQSTTQTTTARFRELGTPDAPAPEPPAAPASLSAEATAPTVIEVQWPASAGATSYLVERRGPGEAAYTQIAAGVAGTSYRDSGLTPQAAYAYRVRAQNAAGLSTYSPVDSATTSAALPGKPGSLVASAVSASRVDVNWDPAPGAATYRLERKGSGETEFVEVAAGLTTTDYTDGAVLPGSSYAYRVRAQNAAGFSAYSDVDDVNTPPDVRPGFRGVDVGDPTPGGATAEVVEGEDYDLVAGGTDVNGAADRFHFAYKALTGDFDVRVRLQSLSDTNAWTKAGLMARDSLTAGSRNVFVLATPGRNGYRISSRFSDGGATLVTGATTGGKVSYPNTWLRLRRVGSSCSGFRSSDGVTWSLIGSRTVNLAPSLYFGMALTSHDTRATAAAEFRDLSDVAGAGPVVPAAPAGLTASAASPSQVDLSWNASAGATGYRVERKGPGDDAFGEIARVGGTSYRDNTVAAGAEYAYRVRAENAAGASAPGAAALVTTPAPEELLVGADVGSPAPAGSTSFLRAGDYDINAGGTDVNGATDRFHFASRRVTGDFDVKVRLQSLGASSEWAKAGIMAREDLTGGSRNVFALATPGANGYRVSSRGEASGTTFVNGSGAVGYPDTWLRLKRQGADFIAYRSANGSDWTQIGTTRTVALPDALYLGLAVTSHNTQVATTAQFREYGTV